MSQRSMRACDRCGEDAEALYPAPDLFADYYADVCEVCERDLERRVARAADFGKGDE